MENNNTIEKSKILKNIEEDRKKLALEKEKAQVRKLYNAQLVKMQKDAELEKLAQKYEREKNLIRVTREYSENGTFSSYTWTSAYGLKIAVILETFLAKSSDAFAIAKSGRVGKNSYFLPLFEKVLEKYGELFAIVEK